MVNDPVSSMKEILSFLNVPLDERRLSCLPYVDFSLRKRRASISRSPFSKQAAAKVNPYISSQYIIKTLPMYWSPIKPCTCMYWNPIKPAQVLESMKSIDSLLISHNLPPLPWTSYNLPFWTGQPRVQHNWIKTIRLKKIDLMQYLSQDSRLPWTLYKLPFKVNLVYVQHN